MISSSLIRKPSKCLTSLKGKFCSIFDYYYQGFQLNLYIRASRAEIENKVLKDSGVHTRLSVIKLAKIDIMQNKRRESNIEMERDHVNRTIIVLEDPVVRDLANHLS